MVKKNGTVYENTIPVKGDATMTLSADERMIVIGALTKCILDEVDILPIIKLMDRMVKGS